MRMKEFFLMEARLLHMSEGVANLFAPRSTAQTENPKQKKSLKKRKSREARERAAELLKYASRPTDCRDGL